MQAWMDGYESDIEYTAGYYRVQEPNFLNLCLVTHGVEPTDLDDGFVYCELGCGQGITALVMAANYPQGKFYAVDFNPAHIAKARKLAKQAGLDNVVFLEKSFEELANDPGILPECDFVVMHGIFSWVSENSRQYIIDILKNNLKAGGVVYNSYNTKPGWSVGEPMQKMLFAASGLFVGNSVQRLENSTKMLDEFFECNPYYFHLNKEQLTSRQDALKSKDKHYLVHEYLHDSWRAFYFTEIAEYLAAAKLNFAGEASTIASLVSGMLPAKNRQFLARIPDKSIRELFRDVMLNTAFRKDIYVKGMSAGMNKVQQLAYLGNTHWMLRKSLSEKEKAEFKFKTPIGTVDGKVGLYRPVVDALEVGGKSFAQLQQALGYSAKELTQVLMFLHHAGYIEVQWDTEINPAVERLNKVFASHAFDEHKINHVIMPFMKTTISLSNPMDMIFYYAALMLDDESKEPGKLAEYIAQELESRNSGVKHEGKELRGEAMRRRLREIEAGWRQVVWPILHSGGAFVRSACATSR